MFEPFVTPSLRQVPFNSRIDKQYSSAMDKNYFLIGFNPGYALQASELNEIQELFFMNLNLTQRMNYNWSVENTFNIPFWEGLIPLIPEQIQITDAVVTSNSFDFKVTCDNGWYLWTDPDSRMSHWIYKNLSATGTIEKTFTMPLSTTRYIGYVLNKEIITCCPDSTCESTEDDTLRDNSDGSDVGQYNTCGASRFKISFDDDTDSYEIRSNALSNSSFRSIIRIDSSSTNTRAYFIDGQEIPITYITP